MHLPTTWVGLFVFLNILSSHQGSSTIWSLHEHTFQSVCVCVCVRKPIGFDPCGFMCVNLCIEKLCLIYHLIEHIHGPILFVLY